jgi:hypothetical protein
MANINNIKNMYFGFFRNQKYDGRTPIKDFLTDFGNIKNEITMLDAYFPGLMWHTLLCTSLNDAESPPNAGVDSGRYTCLRTWVRRQRTADVDTYDTLVKKLQAKFNINVDKMEADVMAELRRLFLHLSKITGKEFSDQFNVIIGDKDIAGYVLSEIIVAIMTQAVLSELKPKSHWREETFQDVVKLLTNIDESIRHPDPLSPKSSAAMDSETAQWH